MSRRKSTQPSPDQRLDRGTTSPVGCSAGAVGARPGTAEAGGPGAPRTAFADPVTDLFDGSGRQGDDTPSCGCRPNRSFLTHVRTTPMAGLAVSCATKRSSRSEITRSGLATIDSGGTSRASTGASDQSGAWVIARATAQPDTTAPRNISGAPRREGLMRSCSRRRPRPTACNGCDRSCPTRARAREGSECRWRGRGAQPRW